MIPIFLLIIIILSFTLTWLIRNQAIRKSIIDTPNERSSHTLPTPRGGGLAIVIAFYGGLCFLFFKNRMDDGLFYALLSGIPLVIVSLIDDVITLPAKTRIVVQSLSISGGLYFVGGLNTIDIGLFSIQSTILLTSISFVGLLWFINLYNFIDGIDGYATSQAIFAGLVIFVITRQPVALLLPMASLGFLPWNWQRAKIFMGDVGSTFIGFVLGILAIYFQNTQQLALPLWLIAVSLFWFDATLTLYRRWKNKEKLSQPHRKHAYQRIVQYGFSHQKTVLSAMLINAVLAVAVWTGYMIKPIILPLLLLVIFFLYLIVRRIDRLIPFQ